MGGDGGNHHEKLGLKRISCASQFTIPDTAGTTPNLAVRNRYTRYSKPIQASPTAGLSYPIVSFPSSSPISRSVRSSQNSKLSHPSQSLHAMITS
jgi:hypothetical protein